MKRRHCPRRFHQTFETTDPILGDWNTTSTVVATATPVEFETTDPILGDWNYQVLHNLIPFPLFETTDPILGDWNS